MNGIHVWERHRLGVENLGEFEGDRVHDFESMTNASRFVNIVMKAHPQFNPRCVRILKFSDTAFGYDFGSWSDFLIVTADFPMSFEQFESAPDAEKNLDINADKA